MSISGSQIRAARALLDWDAELLGSKTGLTGTTILNIEKGRGQGRDASLEKIVKVFANSGIDFTEGDGVRRKRTGVEVYEGGSRFDEFYNFLYEHLRDNGGDVCLSITDERLLSKYRSDSELHFKRMRELHDGGKIKSFRVLATESDFETGHGYNLYRWQPEASLSPTAFYTFGDCLALISFAHNPAPYVVVLQSAPLAEAYRTGFDLAWNSAEKPPSAGRRQ